MKSRVIRAFPYWKVDISRYQKRFQYDEGAITAEIKRIRNRYVTWTEGAPVSEGDVVQVRLCSSLARYQREELTLTIGARLFDAELEASMLGKCAGETVSLEKQGEPVTAEILRVRNKQLPELSDEMIRALDLPEASTLEEYRAYLRAQQLEQRFYDDSYVPMKYIKDRVLAESEILLCKEDWAQYVALRLQQLKGMARKDGLDLEIMTAEEFEGRIPVTSYDGLIALLREEAWDNCCISLLGRKLAEEDGFTVTREEYETFLESEAEAWKQPLEELRSWSTYELYELNSFAMHYNDVIGSWLKEHLYLEV